MRFLVVSKHFPVNLTTMVHGVFKRFQMLLEAIGEIATVDLLYYVPPAIDTSPGSTAQYEAVFSKHFKVPLHLSLCPMVNNAGLNQKIMGYAKGIFSFVRQPAYARTGGFFQMQALETCLKRKPDGILVHRLEVMSPFFLTREKLPPVFLDLDDIEHVAFKRRLRYLPKIGQRIRHMMLYPTLRRGEKLAIQLARRTFVCSDHDLNYLKDLWKAEGLVKIPNAVVIPAHQKITSKTNLLFLGSYRYKPNLDAAEFLIHRIWPLVRAKVPSATLLIAGHPPENVPSFRAGIRGVSFTGFVEDLDDLYLKTRVVGIPILSGSGTRVKILEAAAYGKPIVSTSIGAEGLDMLNEKEIIIRDNHQSFAEACIRLLNDAEKCNQIGEAGRAIVVKNYNREKVKETIKETILQGM